MNSSTAMAEPSNPKMPDPIHAISGNSVLGTVTTLKIPDGCLGFLDVFIHEARDIHNICIYQKQDVYAKISLTTDPNSSVSTQIINGGGRNPVFNQNFRLNVQTLDSSLKCEIWMLSRVKNYLEDQLLGFSLVPLSDVVMAAKGKLEQEFSLSSTDLFHSPAGFVQLSISYTGSYPEILAITPSPKSSAVPETVDEFEKIEFPDLNVVNENKMMVSQYLEMSCSNVDCEGSEDLIPKESDACSNNDAGVQFVERFIAANSSNVDCEGSEDLIPKESDACSNNDAGVQFVERFIAANSSDSISESTNGFSVDKDKSTEDEIDSFALLNANGSVVEKDKSTSCKIDSLPVINIKIEQEQTVVQQEIVDMYMKSMQQFTDSLAKMKLPMDFEKNNTGSSSSSSSSGGGGSTTENADLGSGPSGKTFKASQKTGMRVFYGSRAFF